MSAYTKEIRANILPLSVAQTLPQAFGEWRFTDNMIDHLGPIETCRLCGKQKIRYHFEIGNDQTDSTLWVGSHCILKFDVAVIQGGRRLSPEKAKQHLKDLTQQMQHDACVGALRELTEKEPQNLILAGALARYQRERKLTPKQAAVVFWRLKLHQIEHHASFFKIEMKSDLHIRHIGDMPPGRLHRLWPALSSSQRKKAIALGHKPPPTKP